MEHNQIFESSDFIVVVSDDIKKEIRATKRINQESDQKIREWCEFIKKMETHFSNRAIVWSYRDCKLPNEDGFIYVDDIYTATFRLEDECDIPFVYIQDVDLKQSDYGLKSPSLTECNDWYYTSLRDYIIEQKYINTTYKMKSLQQYISEQMVCEGIKDKIKSLISSKIDKDLLKDCDKDFLEKYGKQFQQLAEKRFEYNGDMSIDGILEYDFYRKETTNKDGHLLYIVGKDKKNKLYVQGLYVDEIKCDNYSYFYADGSDVEYETEPLNDTQIKKMKEFAQIFGFQVF